MIRWGFLTILFFICFACNDTKQSNYRIKITQEILEGEIDGISGIEAFGKNKWILIADNQTHAFILNKNLQIVHSFAIWGDKKEKNQTIVKSEKHDFEAICSFTYKGEDGVLVFGSGNDFVYRSKAVFISKKTYKSRIFNLAPFYKHLLKKMNWTFDSLNIEAANTYNGELILVNKVNNQFITINEIEMQRYLSSGKLPTIFLKKQVFKSDFEFAISGLNCDSTNGKLIFTANNEERYKADIDYKMVSVIGVISNSKPLIYTSGKHFDEVKLESIVLTNEKKGICVADQDAYSLLYRFKMKTKKSANVNF
jgi:hypothetical protein